MRFLANENIPLKSVKILREAKYDVRAVIDDMRGATDEKILGTAAIDHRIILTFDRDYGELIFKRHLPIPSGVIYFRFIPRYPSETAELLIRVLQMKDVAIENRFTVLERDRIRQRPLLR